MKYRRVLLLPPGQDASLLQGYPPAVCRPYPFIHLGKERHPEVREVNHSATHATTCSFLCRSLFWRAMQGARDETLRTGAKATKLLVSTFDISQEVSCCGPSKERSKIVQKTKKCAVRA